MDRIVKHPVTSLHFELGLTLTLTPILSSPVNLLHELPSCPLDSVGSSFIHRLPRPLIYMPDYDYDSHYTQNSDLGYNYP